MEEAIAASLPLLAMTLKMSVESLRSQVESKEKDNWITPPAYGLWAGSADKPGNDPVLVVIVYKQSLWFHYAIPLRWAGININTQAKACGYQSR